MSSSLQAETQLLNSSLVQFETIWDRNATTFCQIDQDHIEKINEVQAYLEKVEKLVGLGCSNEVLSVAVNSMSSLVQALSDISSISKLRSSL